MSHVMNALAKKLGLINLPISGSCEVATSRNREIMTAGIKQACLVAAIQGWGV